jgi:hypothetical protein
MIENKNLPRRFRVIAGSTETKRRSIATNSQIELAAFAALAVVWCLRSVELVVGVSSHQIESGARTMAHSP